MSYRSPVADILFSLKAVAGMGEKLESASDADFDWETISSVVTEAGRFATEEIAPLNRTGDIAGARYENGIVTTPPGFADVYRRWSEAGWGGVSAPPEFGGMGLPHLVDVACVEIWSGACMAFSLCPLLTEGAVGALRSVGSSDLLRSYMRPMISGRWSGTMNLPAVRSKNLHHLRRARHGREHRPLRARAVARRAPRNARDFTVPRPQISCQPGRIAWRSQRPALRGDRAQARHPWLAHLRHALRRRQSLARGRGKPRPCGDVLYDERGAPRHWSSGGRDRGPRLSAGSRLRARTAPGAKRQERPGHGAHR